MKRILFICCNWRCAEKEFQDLARKLHGAPGVEVCRNPLTIKDGQTEVRYMLASSDNSRIDGLDFDEVKDCGNPIMPRYFTRYCRDVLAARGPKRS